MTQPVPPQAAPPSQDQGAAWQTTPRQPEPPPPPPPGPAPATSSWASSLTSTAPVPGPAGFFYADVPNRIIAYIVDLIVLAIVNVVVALVIGGLLGGIVTTTTGADGFESIVQLNLGALLVVSLVSLALSLAYFGYFWTAQRGTPGMKLLGLQIGDERDGHSIDRDQALVRWLILGIPSILSTFASFVSDSLGFILSLVGLIWLVVLLYTIAQSPTKQGLHDRYARTIMVKSARRAA